MLCMCTCTVDFKLSSHVAEKGQLYGISQSCRPLSAAKLNISLSADDGLRDQNGLHCTVDLLFYIRTQLEIYPRSSLLSLFQVTLEN